MSVPDIGDGVVEMHTTGDAYLGGGDDARRIVDYLVTEFLRSSGIDLRTEPLAMRRLSGAAERAKAELSAFPQTSVSLPFICSDKSGAKHLDITLTRSALAR